MVLRDANSLSIIFKLINRGLSDNQIDRAMRQMVGRDWREIDASEWFKRLRSEGHILQNDHELTVTDLEALIQGRLKLDDLSKCGKIEGK